MKLTRRSLLGAFAALPFVPTALSAALNPYVMGIKRSSTMTFPINSAIIVNTDSWSVSHRCGYPSYATFTAPFGMAVDWYNQLGVDVRLYDSKTNVLVFSGRSLRVMFNIHDGTEITLVDYMWEMNR